MSRPVKTLGLIVVAAVVAACAAVALHHGGQRPTGPQRVGVIQIDAQPLALDPAHPGPRRIGALTFLWGAALRSPSTSRFTGLSGLEVEAAGETLTFTAVTDDGDLMRWTAPTAAHGRFTTVTAAFAPLRDLRGGLFINKPARDSEDLSLDEEGGLYVAFEGDHRVWRYAGPSPLADLRPTRAPAYPRLQDVRPNRGFESVAVLPWQGGRALAVGAEDGRIWLCPLPEPGPCRLLTRQTPPGFSLVSLDHLPGTGDLIALYRAYDPVRGMRAVIARLTPSPSPRLVELARLAHPLERENFEGIAAVPDPAGGYTLWIVSDDGFPPRARTLLYAFRYAPPD